MSRLIDADALSHKFFEIGCHITKIHPMDVMNIISEQPTAYDVDAVVAELKEISEIYCKEYNQREGSLYIQDAVEIVRKGGSNE